MTFRVSIVAVSLAFCLWSTAFAQKPDYTQDCTTAACHGSLTKAKHVHNPLTQGACESCHEVDDEDAHTFTFTEEGAALCMQCHDAFEGDDVHDPVKNGECLSCHDPHKSNTAGLLLTDTVAETCLQCHDDLLDDLKYQHGPAAVGACTMCHNPHASDHGKLLKAEGAGLCTVCHETMAKRLAAAKTVHAPVQEDCLSCHHGHGGDNRFFLAEKMPTLCLDCHDDINELVESAPVGHDAVTKGRACAACHDPHASKRDALLVGESMDLCLSCHDNAVKKGDQTLPGLGKLLAKMPHHHGPIQEKDCVACHAPHGGEYASLLAEAFPARFYAPFKEDAYALCFECHDSELATEKETEDATGFRNGTRNLHYLHVDRPVKGRTCRACHNVHASDNAKHITHTVRFGAWNLPINYKPTPNGGTCQPGCHKPYSYDREKPVTNLEP